MMSEQPGVMRQMPRYKCHKEVSALQITKIMTGGTLAFAGDFAPLHVGEGYFARHHPQPGGYYVIYDDGYASYSPAKAFEEGYAKLESAVEQLAQTLAEENPDLPCEENQNEVLLQRATMLRKAGHATKENPHFPGIPCASCDAIAVEGWHFCSDECRLDYMAKTSSIVELPS